MSTEREKLLVMLEHTSRGLLITIYGRRDRLTIGFAEKLYSDGPTSSRTEQLLEVEALSGLPRHWQRFYQDTSTIRPVALYFARKREPIDELCRLTTLELLRAVKAMETRSKKARRVTSCLPRKTTGR